MKTSNIIKQVNKNGGATLTSNLNNNRLKGGYMVSLRGYERRYKKMGACFTKALNQYSTLAKSLNAYVGLWVDNGLIYLDLSINVKDKEKAIKKGLDNKQLAIYNISDGSYIRLA